MFKTHSYYISNITRKYPAFLVLCPCFKNVVLGGLVVTVLAVGPKVRIFKPSRGCLILREIKIRSTLYFGWEIKPSAPCRKILRHVKQPFKV
jgi:hypothetical protein